VARNLQSHSFTRKRRARFYWILALVIIIIISWLCAISFLTRLNAFAITEIKVFGADADITGALQSAAEQAIAGDYFAIFPRDSTLIYPKSGIVAAVKSASPRVLDVSVSRAGLHSLIISVSEKAPATIVCAALPDFNGNALVFDDPGSCYLADDNGLIFEAMSTASAPSPLPPAGPAFDVYYAPDLSGIPSSNSPVGSYATSTTEFAALRSFYDGARTIGISPDGLLIKEGGEYELYASTTVIYFNDTGSISGELNNLAAFWTNMTSTARTSGKPSPSFDYIDLRYGNNVVYKQNK
jgi:hypothetical protein